MKYGALVLLAIVLVISLCLPACRLGNRMGQDSQSDPGASTAQGGTASNKAPKAIIQSISPSPSAQGDTVRFKGTGNDEDGTILAYRWISSKDGTLSSKASFETKELSAGTHTIYFLVMDNNRARSEAVQSQLVVNAPSGQANTSAGSSGTAQGPAGSNQPPRAHIISVSPTQTTVGNNISFVGEGTDEDGTVVAYSWISSIDGTLSTAASFSSNSLSAGSHVIYFQVKDNRGQVSAEVLPPKLVVNAASGQPSASTGSQQGGAASQPVNEPLEVRVQLEPNSDGDYGYPEGTDLKVIYNINQKAKISICRTYMSSPAALFFNSINEGQHNFTVSTAGNGMGGICALTVTAETEGGARKSAEAVYYIYQPGENKYKPLYEQIVREFKESSTTAPMDAGIKITSPYNAVNGYIGIHYRLSQPAQVTLSVYYPNGDSYDIFSDHVMREGSYDTTVRGGTASGTGKIKLTAVSHNGSVDKKYVEYTAP